MPVIDAGAQDRDSGGDGAGRAVTEILTTIAATTPAIRDALGSRRHAVGSVNPSGETQLAADTFTDEVLEERLLALGGVSAYASEEREHVVGDGDGLSVAVDPLDGSGNLASNNSLGIVLGIYDAPLPAAGGDLVAAAVVTFGPITVMITARNDTVTEYLLEGGVPTVLRSDVSIPDDPEIFALGGREWEWDKGFQQFANELRDEYKLRYTGAVIADLPRILTNGGIYAYPAVESYPNGKPRHQFEAVPISYIVEAAGGGSSDETGSLLRSSVDELHARTPLAIGNESLVERFEASR
ncbi:class 1 fructose-bisphosphatase [Halorhabdus rudnickae]|uniref:class 1 fructose-bisphosphatase n=1 Tax=Halorhabdus rudnickae TaxID=1775544 RepID=UPI0010844B42|nr:class 1 fructose-bisphosphatase [Halorhabdus rudnickae]